MLLSWRGWLSIDLSISLCCGISDVVTVMILSASMTISRCVTRDWVRKYKRTVATLKNLCNFQKITSILFWRWSDWCIYASALTLMCPQRFISARFVPPPHLSAIVGSPAHPNELQTCKIYGVCRTRMPQCTCIDGPFRPHFTGARAKGEKFSNKLAAYNFFQSFRPVDLRSPTELSPYSDRSLIEATCTLRMTCPVNNGTMGHGG